MAANAGCGTAAGAGSGVRTASAMVPMRISLRAAGTGSMAAAATARCSRRVTSTRGTGVVTGVAGSLLLPTCLLPPLDTTARAQRLALTLAGAPAAIRAALPEAARRFRLAERPLARAAAAASALGAAAGAHELFAVCRAEARLELDGLANLVHPRFTLGELVLPPAQTQQLCEIVSAMAVLGRVHYCLLYTSPSPRD